MVSTSQLSVKESKNKLCIKKTISAEDLLDLFADFKFHCKVTDFGTDVV